MPAHHRTRLHRWLAHLATTPVRVTCAQGPASSADTSNPGRTRQETLAEYHAETTRRAQHATRALVRRGYHIGPTPYGYRKHRVPGSRISTLKPDPHTGAVVSALYAWRADEHLPLAAIVERLASNPRQYPPPTDATGRTRRWSTGRVRTILTNPVYTGRTVWGRTHHQRPIPGHEWITSPRGAHPALVDEDTFARVAATVAAPTRLAYRSQS